MEPWGDATLRHGKGGMRGEGARASSLFCLLAGFCLDRLEDPDSRVAGHEQRHEGEEHGEKKKQEKEALARGLLGLALGNHALAGGRGDSGQGTSPSIGSR